jgi:DNA-binding transcriptional MerR regulator
MVRQVDVYVNVKHYNAMTSTAEASRTARAAHAGPSERTWTVGELADELGITTRTLRFYEAEGLIAPGRSGAARIYDHRDRARLRLILRGKRFGMSLSEIREIVDMYDGAASSERRQLEILLARLGEISTDLTARQRDLQRIMAEVGEVAQQCRDRLAQLS